MVSLLVANNWDSRDILDQPVAEIVPKTQPAFARLRRATARPASPAEFREILTREGCLDEARAAGEVGLQFLQLSDISTSQTVRTLAGELPRFSRRLTPRNLGTVRAISVA